MNRNIFYVECFLNQYTDEYDNPTFYVEYDETEDTTKIRFSKNKKLVCCFKKNDYEKDTVIVHGEIPMDFISGCYEALTSDDEVKE